jgi:hypothetical protein
MDENNVGSINKKYIVINYIINANRNNYWNTIRIYDFTRCN